MKARLYISVEGGAFKPEPFHFEAAKSLPGQVRRRKHTGAPLANVPLEYWASNEKVVAPEDVGDALRPMLEIALPLLEPHSKASDTRVCVHIVFEFKQGEEPIGMNLSRETLSLLDRIGAELDVDAVPTVST